MTLKGWKLDVQERDGFRCKICGSKHDLTVHHKLPSSRGGKGCLSNCVCWCRKCHSEYHSRWGLTTSDDFGNPAGARQFRKSDKH